MYKEDARSLAKENLSLEDGKVSLLHPRTGFFLEALEEKGWIWEVVLIRAGYSANKNFYPPEILQEASPLFEGIRALARSDEDHLQNKEKYVKNIVGWFDNVYYVAPGSPLVSEGGLVARFTISKAAGWLRTLVKDGWVRGKKDLVGLSIVAEGQGRLRKTSDGFVRVVETIDRVSSVDVVVDPAAGGKFLKLVAANDAIKLSDSEVKKGNTTLKEGREVMEKLLNLLETKAPALYSKVDPEDVTEKGVLELLGEAMESAQYLATGDEESVKVNGKELKELHANGRLEEKEKITEAVQNLRRQRCRLILAETLAKTDLPEPVKNLVRDRFVGKIFDPKKLEEEIIMQKETLARLTESGDIRGLGGARIEVAESEREKTIKALDGFFASDNVDGIPRFKSFREAYIAITGDKNLTGRLCEAGNLHKFSEALSTSSWAEILGDSINRRMLAEYNSPGLSDWRKVVSDITAISDFRTNRRMRMGGYGILPAVAESGTYTELTSPGDEEATYAVSKYGGLETITMEMIANDDVGAIRRIPQKLGRAAAISLYRFVFDFIKDNPATTYDSKALFHADHNNLGSSALAASSLLNAKIAMADQTAYGTSADILGLMPKCLLVPSELAWD
jgi:hypothetical protein